LAAGAHVDCFQVRNKSTARPRAVSAVARIDIDQVLPGTIGDELFQVAIAG
jgi:hypothetical protein